MVDGKLIGVLQFYGLSAFYYVVGVPHEVSSLIKHTIKHLFPLEMQYRLTEAETEVVDRLLSAAVGFFAKGKQYYISHSSSCHHNDVTTESITNSILAPPMSQKSEKYSRSAKRCAKKQSCKYY